jgi:ubiquinone/menaquinone biosynthesis C-methylase UbiE
MSHRHYGETYAGSLPENYERYFVPSIGAPLARDLVEAAALREGERVLDVACGTGIVTRLAAERVGGSGSVAGLDVNAGMLAVARTVTPPAVAIDWYETSAEAMPLPDESRDVVLCQMGLQFIANKLAALREIRRVLAPGGRVVLSVPGPTPPPFVVLAEALERHVAREAGAFVHAVFSLHEPEEIRTLLEDAGFDDVAIRRDEKALHGPAPRDFLWQYVHSTPLAGVFAGMDDGKRDALETEVSARWGAFAEEEGMVLPVGMTTATATAT